MESIKNTLSYWQDNKEGFDSKLVAREETGCCEVNSGMGGTADGSAPCEE